MQSGFKERAPDIEYTLEVIAYATSINEREEVQKRIDLEKVPIFGTTYLHSKAGGHNPNKVQKRKQPGTVESKQLEDRKGKEDYSADKCGHCDEQRTRGEREETKIVADIWQDGQGLHNDKNPMCIQYT